MHLDMLPLYLPFTCTPNAPGPELHKNTLAWTTEPRPAPECGATAPG